MEDSYVGLDFITGKDIVVGAVASVRFANVVVKCYNVIVFDDKIVFSFRYGR